MSATAQEERSIKTAFLLQKLKEEGLTHISSSMIQEWYQALDLDPLPTAQSLIDRLKFLWRILEEWKVSNAVTYNPLMTACGYIYQGHDFFFTNWQLQETQREPHLESTPRVSGVGHKGEKGKP